jgi:hypothetical protein
LRSSGCWTTSKSAPRHSDNPFLPRREKAKRQTINLEAAEEAVARAGRYA